LSLVLLTSSCRLGPGCTKELPEAIRSSSGSSCIRTLKHELTTSYSEYDTILSRFCQIGNEREVPLHNPQVARLQDYMFLIRICAARLVFSLLSHFRTTGMTTFSSRLPVSFMARSM
jgi:hypothetical protein